VIGTTAEHPFYAADKGWVPAKELRLGDRVLLESGNWLPVDGVADSGRVETVYNLEVEGDHTYFVGDPGWGFAVWAHNTYRTLLEAGLTMNARGVRLRATSPLPIPAGVAGKVRQMNAGYKEIRYTWTEGGIRYTARLHEPSGGAPSGSGVSWVVERKILGSPKGIKSVQQVAVRDPISGSLIWEPMHSWKAASIAHASGAHTPAQANLLRRGHWELPQ
jgi:hypothetical protein